MTYELDLIVRDGLIYADIPFWSKVENRYLKARVLIDTGARITTFGSSALKRLGYYSEDKKANVKTASGVAEVYEIVVPSIKFGAIELNNVRVHALTYLDNFYFDGIIGMNVLSEFNFAVNLDEKFLTLEKRGSV